MPVDADAQLLCDLDLSILGAEDERYRAYAAAIEREAAVPHAVFARHRSAFLESMLAKPLIFHAPQFQAEYENRARTNMQRELTRLRRGLGPRSAD